MVEMFRRIPLTIIMPGKQNRTKFPLSAEFGHWHRRKLIGAPNESNQIESGGVKSN